MSYRDRNLGAIICEIRKQAGFLADPSGFAARCGLTTKQLESWEKLGSEPRLSTLQRVAARLHVRLVITIEPGGSVSVDAYNRERRAATDSPADSSAALDPSIPRSLDPLKQARRPQPCPTGP